MLPGRLIRPAIVTAAVVSAALQLMPAAARAQTAPAPRLVVTAEDNVDQFAEYFRPLRAGERMMIEIRGAGWLQLKFAPVEGDGEFLPLDRGGASITLQSFSGEYWEGQRQTYTPGQLRSSGASTALFNGGRLAVQIGDEADGDIALYRIQELVVGLQGTLANYADLADPIGIIRTRDIPSDIPVPEFIMRGPDRDVPLDQQRDCSTEPGTFCGPEKRTRWRDKRVGRIAKNGCTAFIIRDNHSRDGKVHYKHVTAGHCRRGADYVEFNVKPSRPNGTIVVSDARDQYAILQDSSFENTPGKKRGDDWGVFRVQKNATTCKRPFRQQGGFFTADRAPEPQGVRVTGFGAAQGRENRTLYSAIGQFLGHHFRDPYKIELRHDADALCGNSGSPIMPADEPHSREDGAGVLIGVHTHGGCHTAERFNIGTSVRHQGFWNAIQRHRRPKDPPCRRLS